VPWVIAAVVFAVAIIISAVILLGGAGQNTPPIIGSMGISPEMSSDRTAWVLTFASVPSGLTMVETTLTIYHHDGSLNLTKTAFSDLSFVTNGASYVGDGDGYVEVSERIFLKTSWYLNGSMCEVENKNHIIWHGSLLI